MALGLQSVPAKVEEGETPGGAGLGPGRYGRDSSSGTEGTRAVILAADHAHIPERAPLAETAEQWQDGILAYMETGIPSAASRGKPRDQARSPQRPTASATGQPAPAITLGNDPRGILDVELAEDLPELSCLMCTIR